MQHLLRSRLGRWLLGIMSVGAVLALWAFVIEPRRLVIIRQTLAVPALPPGLKIAAFSDLHAGAPHITRAKLQEVVAQTNAQQADVILLLGDYVIQGVAGGQFMEPEVIAAELRELRAPLGVYAVLGNHDHWHDGKQISRAFAGAGIQMLDNRVQRLAWRGQPFWLLGLGDEWEDKADVPALIAQINDAAPVLAFTHNPDTFARLPERVALTLAGHTHGGQCAVPFFGRPLVPSDYGQRFAYGHVDENGHHLFVTSGIGTSVLPVRFRVPPEILLLTITP